MQKKSASDEIRHPKQSVGVKRISADEKRLLILQEAIDLFSANGFHRSSVDELAKRIGVTKPFIYSYFPNKQSLLESVYEVIRNVFFTRLHDVLAVKRSPDQQLYELMKTYALVSFHHSEMTTILLNEERDLPQTWQDRSKDDYDEFVRMVSEILREGMDMAIFDVVDPTISAQFITGMVRWSHRWYDRSSAPSPDDLAAIAAKHALNAVSAPSSR